MSDTNHDNHDTDLENVTGVDSDRTDGSLKNAAGNIKEGAGKLFGDDKLEHDGEAEQAEGKTQNTWGGIKDEAREIFGGKDDD